MKTYTEVLEKLNNVKSQWTWKEAVRVLELNQTEQLLLCALWGHSAEYGREMNREELWEIFSEIRKHVDEESVTELPEWIYESDGQVLISPVLTAWLEERMPKLPNGASLVLAKEQKAYGLEAVLKDAKKIFDAADEKGIPAVLCIEGEKGSGRQFCMEQICARQGLAMIVLNADVFKGSERELNACVLCAKLYGAFVCVKLEKEVREKLLADLSECFTFFGIIKEEKRELAEQPDVLVYTRKLSRPDRVLKTQIVKEELGEFLEKLLEAVQMTQLTGKQLPMGAYLRYLRTIRAEMEAGTFCQEQIQASAVSTSLNLLPATRTFAELKLPKAQYDQLQKICKMIAAREDVMNRWGFGSKFTYGNGMSVLFYGAPGTGKTMAAQVLANALGMPLYRVDLSQLISKYIGETQKNIGRIFDEAEKCDCILLFDEADAIFAKRSDVSDAQDRYSNAETAYLLQRIEQYAGVSILATNLLQNFDEAFRRRISYMVHFPMPDVQLRAQLWESIFPADTPLSREVDPLMLAQAFELSGASIKNAALHGALLAKAEECEVRMFHILDGIRNEYGKQGKSFSSSQKELLDAYQ